jgi:hypothetical protein
LFHRTFDVLAAPNPNKASGKKEKKATERRGEHLDDNSRSHTTLEFLLCLKLVPTKADEEDMSLKTATD